MIRRSVWAAAAFLVAVRAAIASLVIANCRDRSGSAAVNRAVATDRSPALASLVLDSLRKAGYDTMALALALMLPAGSGRAQAVSPGPSGEAVRFDRVVKAVNGVGYSHASVVGHGAGTADALFALLATTRGDSGVLLVTMQPGRSAAHPVVLERARTPSDLGVRGVQVAPFLGTRDLYDIEVNHQPFGLETSHTYSTHHVIRQHAEVISLVCALDGSSSSSYSKGIGGNPTTRDVTIVRVPGIALTFSVRIVAKSVERRAREAAPTVDSTESVKWYELPAVGTCREVRAPKP